MISESDFWALDRRNKERRRLNDNMAKLIAATGLTVPEIVELLREELLDLIRAELVKAEPEPLTWG